MPGPYVVTFECRYGDGWSDRRWDFADREKAIRHAKTFVPGSAEGYVGQSSYISVFDNGTGQFILNEEI